MAIITQMLHSAKCYFLVACGLVKFLTAPLDHTRVSVVNTSMVLGTGTCMVCSLCMIITFFQGCTCVLISAQIIDIMLH